ncbi:hypothetical protein TrST_g11690 [Triparma strigata]|uniref:Transcription factor TFIIIB component B'' Myb domain-containing protein n=1 Tax=Triparma strigata TaxID=1606541 RepID=A0A9W7EM72_9STRA|nr:hypothetical protein TrST_g11690 [Triparma strigata]
MTATYASFTSRSKSMGWTAKDTSRFYDVLKRVGMDFNTMNIYFPERSRKQLLRKFKGEERRRPDLVRMSLDRRVREGVGIYVEGGEVRLEEVGEYVGRDRKRKEKKRKIGGEEEKEEEKEEGEEMWI